MTTALGAVPVHWILHCPRGMHVHPSPPRGRDCTQHDNADTQKRRVGILGRGELGQGCAHALTLLGFENLSGWSRTAKDLPGVQSFAGDDGLTPKLQQ